MLRLECIATICFYRLNWASPNFLAYLVTYCWIHFSKFNWSRIWSHFYRSELDFIVTVVTDKRTETDQLFPWEWIFTT